MFSYLRYFAGISLVLVFLAAYLVGMYFKSVASSDLEELVRINNTALTQGYVNSVWEKHKDVIHRLYRIDVTKWKSYPQFIEFRKDTLLYFEAMHVTDLSLYTYNGRVILSTVPLKKQGQQVGEDEKPVLDDAMEGNSASRIIEDATFFRPDGEEMGGTLIQSFVPIVSDNYVPQLADSTRRKVDAVLEINYNVTSQWNRLSSFHVIATGGIIAIFLILIGVLFISSRRAEFIIAKQHEVNLELTAAAATAEAENRDKSQFLANISHELRTPLNAIIGFSEIIRADAASLKAQHQEYITDIHTSGKHLLSLINDILDYSKAEAGKLEVDISEIDAIKMVSNSMRLVLPRAEEAQVSLVEDVPNKHFTLQTDAKKLKQVLLNLLSNAVKFTPSGGEVRLAAWHDHVNDMVNFEVKDTGIGIAPKDISRVMTPFGQVDSTLARKYEGTGLGLPLSKKFVEIMGGTFNIESEVGVGTKITISFPRVFNKGGVGVATPSSGV